MTMTLMEARGIIFANLIINGIYTIEMVPKPYRAATQKELDKRKAQGY